MRELETSLQEFGEFVLKAQLVKEKAAPYCVRWVRRFLTRPASDESSRTRYAGSARSWNSTGRIRSGRCTKDDRKPWRDPAR